MGDLQGANYKFVAHNTHLKNKIKNQTTFKFRYLSIA